MKFVVDIDDTLLYSNNIDGKYELVAGNTKLIKKINGLFENGHEIILWTGRHWNHLEITIEQLKKMNIKYSTVMMGKPVADYYIDDKAILPENFIEMVI